MAFFCADLLALLIQNYLTNIERLTDEKYFFRTAVYPGFCFLQ